jgi:2'-5' RNA ligase
METHHGAMAESAFIVCVPEAEPRVGALRHQYDASERFGVPAHITVLYPFMPPESITADTLEAARAAFARTRPFSFILGAVARFPGMTYLAPLPAEPFIALTQSIMAAFPGYLPYRGAHPSIIPHLTVAHGRDSEADIAETVLQRSLAKQGPVHCQCRSVVLIDNSTGRWRERHSFHLSGASK